MNHLIESQYRSYGKLYRILSNDIINFLQGNPSSKVGHLALYEVAQFNIADNI